MWDLEKLEESKAIVKHSTKPSTLGNTGEGVGFRGSDDFSNFRFVESEV